MSQQLKQLKIKTSILKRLKKQYQSYAKQTKNISAKVDLLEQKQQTQEMFYQIKKNKQFLQESQSVLSNVKLKFIEGFESLTNYLSEKSQSQNFKGTQELTTAENLLLEVQTFLESI